MHNRHGCVSLKTSAARVAESIAADMEKTLPPPSPLERFDNLEQLRRPRKVGVAGRRLHLPVAEELSDHRQALPQCQCPRSEGVSQVVDPDVCEPGPRRNHKPPGVQVAQAPPGPGSGNHPRVVRQPGQGGQHLPRRRRQRHRPCSCLGVPQSQFPHLQAHIVPPERQDLVAPTPG